MNHKIMASHQPKRTNSSSTQNGGSALNIVDFKNNREKQISEEALQRVLNKAKELGW